jgi:hypothetical protein
MIYVNKFPQEIDPMEHITINQLVDVLPDSIPYNLNVWISGDLAKYGKTTQNLCFLIEQDSEPSNELMNYFDSLVKPLGKSATASHHWRNDLFTKLSLYQNGKLIRKEHFVIDGISEITSDYVKEYLPKAVPTHDPIYLTGSIVRQGWSRNDVDFICFNEDTELLANLRKYLSNSLKCKVHVGNQVMPEREPVYLCKTYEEGALCL